MSRLPEPGNGRSVSRQTNVAKAVTTIRPIPASMDAAPAKPADPPKPAELVRFKVVTLTGGAKITDLTLVLANAAAGGFMIKLPEATNGAWVKIKKIDSSVHTIMLMGSGAATIDGATSFMINEQHESRDLMSDGTNWYLI